MSFFTPSPDLHIFKEEDPRGDEVDFVQHGEELHRQTDLFRNLPTLHTATSSTFDLSPNNISIAKDDGALLNRPLCASSGLSQLAPRNPNLAATHTDLSHLAPPPLHSKMVDVRTYRKNNGSLKLLVLGFFLTSLYILIVFAMRHLYLENGALRVTTADPLEYGFYRHYFAILAIFLCALTPLTNELMGREKNPQRWFGYQPFAGGTRFVCLQALAWTLYALSLLSILIIFSFGVSKLGLITNGTNVFTAIASAMVVSQLLVVISINYYQADTRRRNFCAAPETSTIPIVKAADTSTLLKQSTLSPSQSVFVHNTAGEKYPHYKNATLLSHSNSDEEEEDLGLDDCFNCKSLPEAAITPHYPILPPSTRSYTRTTIRSIRGTSSRPVVTQQRPVAIPASPDSPLYSPTDDKSITKPVGLIEDDISFILPQVDTTDLSPTGKARAITKVQSPPPQPTQSLPISTDRLKNLFLTQNTTHHIPVGNQNSRFLQNVIDTALVGFLYHSPLFGGIFASLPVIVIYQFGVIHIVTLIVLLLQTWYYASYLKNSHFTGSNMIKAVYDHEFPLWAAAQRYFDVKMFIFSHNEMIDARVESKQALQTIYQFDKFIVTEHGNNDHDVNTGGSNSNSIPDSNIDDVVEMFDLSRYNHVTLGHEIPYLYYSIGKDRYRELLKRAHDYHNSHTSTDTTPPLFALHELLFQHQDLTIKNPNLQLNCLPPISLIKALHGKSSHTLNDTTAENNNDHHNSRNLVMLPTLSTSLLFAHMPHGIYPFSCFYSSKVAGFVNVMKTRLLNEHARVERYKAHLAQKRDKIVCDNETFDVDCECEDDGENFQDIDVDREYVWVDDILGLKQPTYNRYEAIILRKKNKSTQSSPENDPYYVPVQTAIVCDNNPKIDAHEHDTAPDSNSNKTHKDCSKQKMTIVSSQLDINCKADIKAYEKKYLPLLLYEQGYKYPKHYYPPAGATYSPTDIDTLGASVLSFSPCLRELFLSMNGGDVSKNSFLLRLYNNRSVYIVPGGQKEMPYSKSTDYNGFSFYTRHYGFVKYALSTGTPLVPIIAFGENQVLHTYTWPVVQDAIYRYTRAFIPIYPHGPLFSLLPNSVPITFAVGEPLYCPVIEGDALDDDIIRYYHQLFYTHVAQLFFKFRAAAGYPNAQLTFL